MTSASLSLQSVKFTHESVTPFDIATCMYYTGIDPFTKKPVTVAKGLNDRKMQRGH